MMHNDYDCAGYSTPIGMLGPYPLQECGRCGTFTIVPIADLPAPPPLTSERIRQMVTKTNLLDR